MVVDAPEQYQLFLEERQALEFDTLGATRRMQSDVSVFMDKGDSIGGAQPVPDDGKETLRPSGTRKAFSRFDIVMINFLCVRILIPHVILTPWDVGVGSVGMGKQATANLSSLATVLYLVCRQLSPLPAPAEPIEPPSRLRRLSKSAGSASSTTIDQVRRNSEKPQSQSTADLGGEDAGRSSPEPEGGGSTDTNRFLSIDDIGRRLVLDRNFPCKDPQLIQLVQEHQVRHCVQSEHLAGIAREAQLTFTLCALFGCDRSSKQKKLGQLLRNLESQLHTAQDHADPADTTQSSDAPTEGP
ncbi:hypothetical protein BBJ28_00008415 [Nothophytophthora sp. Chile5]|nr:hypothetical protein BBJ28_00008415 [Nothophytophthora sp. Chile5]